MTPETAPFLLLNYDQRSQALRISCPGSEDASPWAQDALQTLSNRLEPLLAPFCHEAVCAQTCRSIIATVNNAIHQVKMETGVKIGLDIGNLEETMISARAYR